MKNILWNLLKNFLRKDIKIMKLKAKILKFEDIEDIEGIEEMENIDVGMGTWG
jgi:hypothetical protein